MATLMGITMALFLIVGDFDHTAARYAFTQSDEATTVVRAQLAPLPVIPLPAGLSTLLPSQHRPSPTTPRPSSSRRPVSPVTLLGGGGGARPLPTAPKPPPIPVRPSRPSRPVALSKPKPLPSKPTTPPPPTPPPTPTLPPPTRPTPPPPVRPRPRPTTTQRPTTTPPPTTTSTTTTTESPPVETVVTTATGGGNSGATDTVFTVFKMSDDGSYLFDYTAPAIGLRQREEGFLKSIGDAKVPVKRGFFAYTSPEGEPVSLSYQADEYGFRATGDHLPRSLSGV